MTLTFPIEGFHAFIICEVHPLTMIGREDEYSQLPRFPLPVIIPDVIYRFATGGQVADGNPTAAYAVLEWVRGNRDNVRIDPTEAGLQYDILLRNGAGEPSRGQADSGMIESVDSFLAGSTDRKAILVFDDPASRPNWIDNRLHFASLDDFLDIARGRYANTAKR